MSVKINVKDVLEDIQLGMPDHALMTKYELSSAQFETLMKKLDQAGLRRNSGRDGASTAPLSPNDFYQCPACGYTRIESFNECPRCGVIVSKLATRPSVPTDDETPPELNLRPTHAHQHEVREVASSSKLWIVIAAVVVGVITLAALVLGGMWLYRGRQAAATGKQPPVLSKAAKPPTPKLVPGAVAVVSQGPAQEDPVPFGAAPPNLEGLGDQMGKVMDQVFSGFGDAMAVLMVEAINRGAKRMRPEEIRKAAEEIRRNMLLQSGQEMPDQVKRAMDELIQAMETGSAETVEQAANRVAETLKKQMTGKGWKVN